MTPSATLSYPLWNVFHTNRVASSCSENETSWPNLAVVNHLQRHAILCSCGNLLHVLLIIERMYLPQVCSKRGHQLSSYGIHFHVAMIAGGHVKPLLRDPAIGLVEHSDPVRFQYRQQVVSTTTDDRRGWHTNMGFAPATRGRC
jgi:hypothetical protein